MAIDTIFGKIRDNMSGVLDRLGHSVDFSVSVSKPGFGDLSCNVSFLLAKPLKKSPAQIADTIVKMYPKNPMIDSVSAHPSGYVNFVLSDLALESILRESRQDTYGMINLGDSTITIEHTSVNPNKALHIGHVRNIVIGDSLSRILKKANYTVNVLNYVDDSGLQVADIVLGLTRLGFSLSPPDGTKFDHYCGDTIYVQTTAQYEKQPELEQTRRDILLEIEEGRTQNAKLADSVTKRVLGDQLQTCWNLSVYYDCLNYESQIIRSGLWNKIFEKMKQMNLVRFEESGDNAGCWVIPDSKETDKVIVRSNKTATYIAKDIPYAAWKLGLVDDPFFYEPHSIQPDGKTLWHTTLTDGEKKNFAADRVITVIDSRQARLQNIVTSLMDKFKSPGTYIHLGYESVTLSSDTAKSLGLDSGKKQTQMSGRRGLYVNADNVYSALVERASHETRTRNPDMSERDVADTAKAIASGTLRYEMIKQDLDKMINFDLNKSLSLEGDTISYIQYTCARASRILEKASISPNFDEHLLFGDVHEQNLIKKIGLYPVMVRDSAQNLSPKVIARYCQELASAFNALYEHVKVLDSSGLVLNSRVCLVWSFRHTMYNALDLIGIRAPDRM